MANSAQVAWLHGLMDFVFPYLIQFLRQYSTNVDLLMADRKVRCAAACLCLHLVHTDMVNPFLTQRISS